MSNNTNPQSRELPILSQSTVSHLKELRANDPYKFELTVASLCLNKWPLRAIATPLEVSRSGVDIWKQKGLTHFKEGAIVPSTEQMPETVSKEMKAVYSGYTLSPEDEKELRDLTKVASTVRRFTDPTSPARAAAKKLEDRLHEHKARGASYSQLARACKRSRRAIVQRLEKQRDV